MKKTVEIRSFNLKADSRDRFHQLFNEQSLPLHKKWNMDVVAFGPSPHDSSSYYVIRAYDTLEHRQLSQDSFYGSSEWLEGPRDVILSLIESYTSIVLQIDSDTLDSLRQQL